MEEFIKYINKLSWNNSKDEQDEAIDFLSKVQGGNFSNCIRNTTKDIWENLVIVIENRSIEERIDLASELLFLLKDLNWPGSFKGLEILKALPKNAIRRPLQEALNSAYTENDREWISCLNLLVEHFQFVDSDFDIINLSDVLVLRDW